ncbi:hypothetical protein D9M69_616830 [compost metagenome]
MSFGTSSSTGPGRPVVAMSSARRTSAGTSSAARTCRFHLVTGRDMPSASLSWKACVPITAVDTCPLMHSTGTESLIASSSPVIVLPTPGPDVTSTTPTRPVLRA